MTRSGGRQPRPAIPRSAWQSDSPGRALFSRSSFGHPTAGFRGLACVTKPVIVQLVEGVSRSLRCPAPWMGRSSANQRYVMVTPRSWRPGAARRSHPPRESPGCAGEPSGAGCRWPGRLVAVVEPSRRTAVESLLGDLLAGGRRRWLAPTTLWRRGRGRRNRPTCACVCGATSHAPPPARSVRASGRPPGSTSSIEGNSIRSTGKSGNLDAAGARQCLV